MILISDMTATILVLFCIGVAGGLIGTFLGEAALAFARSRGWIEKRTIVLRVYEGKDPAPDQGGDA